MTYRQRCTILFLVDTSIILMAVLCSWFLIFEHINEFILPIFMSSIAILVSYHVFAVKWKLYKKVWEYASIGELVIILKIVSFSVFIAMLVHQVTLQEIYLRFLCIICLFLISFIGGSRFFWRIYRDWIMRKQTEQLRTLIIGAGSAGTMVARQLLHDKETSLLPVGFMDDDNKKQQLDILGLPVIGGVKDIEEVVKEEEIDHIIIAIPSLGKKELSRIFRECTKTKVKTKILPLLEDLITGRVSVSEFRDVEVNDLLVRDPVHLDISSISKYITKKVVLVTGAGGSIGSEIAKQIAQFQPSKLILLGRGENSIYAIEQVLQETFINSGIEFITEIANIQDAEKMMVVMREYQPDVVYHAAAHKHVPLMEKHPDEAVKNNIIGTMNIAKAADAYSVQTFVMISTDKAVHPTSIMGATKKLAEMVIQTIDKNSKTTFVTVRFGNVLGSKGSVIPLFKKQIEQGGPVTITHPDMVRYFMTIPEASKLVIQAGALANGGEIFVLDMGQPVKIVDLAKNLIHLSGFSVEEIGITFTGIRPGEKLFEELLDDNEILPQQLFPKIYMGKSTELYWGDVEYIMSHMASMDKNTLKKTLLNLANKEVVRQPRPVLSIQN